MFENAFVDAVSNDDRRRYSLWAHWADAAGQLPSTLRPTLRRMRSDTSCIGKLECLPIRAGKSNSETQFVLNPGSRWSLLWQFIFTLVLCYELVLFPMSSAFTLLPTPFLERISLFTLGFWTSDFVLTFFAGYYDEKGDLIMQYWKIMVRYTKSWFVADILVLFVDWSTLLWGSSNFIKQGKVLRYLRMARVLRLLRLRKLRESMRQLDDLANSLYFTAFKSALLNMVSIIVISHFLGCFWYIVGKMTADGWVQRYNFAEKETQGNWWYGYLTSLHWAICQFTPGGMEVQPQNSIERIFGILMLVAGMILFSSIISNITSSINTVKHLTGKYDTDLARLRRYFRQENISRKLLMHVTRYADNNIRPRMRQLHLTDVDLLQSLPKPLYLEVVGEIYGSILASHGFFKLLSVTHGLVLEKIGDVLKLEVLSEDAPLFSPSQEARHMYFLTVGELVYSLQRGFQLETRTISPFCGFCEAVLWTPWVFHGEAVALRPSELLSLCSYKFYNVLLEHKNVVPIAVDYALEYLKELNELEAEHGVVSDLALVESAIGIMRSRVTTFEPTSPTGRQEGRYFDDSDRPR